MLLSIDSSFADAEQDNYTPPTRMKIENGLRYPGPAKHGGREGYVAYSVLVLPDGSAEDFSVVYSNGDKAIEKELRKYYERVEFQPATLDGVPVPSRYYASQVFYQIGKFRGASRRFTSDWTKYRMSIANEDYENALKHIRAMEKVGHRSLYEEFYIQLAWSNYYLYQGDGASAYQRLMFIAALYQLQNIESEVIIDPKVYFSPMLNAYQYAVNNELLGDAREIRNLLLEIGPDTQSAKAVSDHFEKAVEQLGDRTLEVAIELKTWPVRSAAPANGIALLRRTFSIEQLSGDLQDATVACEDWHRTLNADEYQRFTVPAGLDRCSLFFRGDEETSVSIAQFPDESSGTADRAP